MANKIARDQAIVARVMRVSQLIFFRPVRPDQLDFRSNFDAELQQPAWAGDSDKLVMAVYFPQSFAQAHEFNDGNSAETLQAERDSLGLDHAALDGEVAKRWHFPPEIREAVELHHTEVRAGVEKTLTDVIYIANLFAHALDDGHIREANAAHLVTAARLRLALEGDKLEALAEEAQRLYDGAVMLIGE